MHDPSLQEAQQQDSAATGSTPWSRPDIWTSLPLLRSRVLAGASRADHPFTDPRADDAAVQRWREARRSGIGGTDLAVIAGLSPYNDLHSLYLEKIGELEPEPPAVPPERLGWGHFLEEPIALEFTRRTGLALSDPGEALFRGPDPFSWLQGSPDRLIVNARGSTIGCLEIKTARNLWSNVPPHYIVQTLAYAICLNLQPDAPLYLACLHMADSELSIWQINLNEILPSVLTLSRIGSLFWDCVTNRIPPTLPKGAVREDHPDPLALPLVDVGNGAGEVNPIARAVELQELIKTLDEELSVLKTAIKDGLGNARFAVCEDRKVIIKTQARTSIDSALLRREKPDIAAAYSKTSTYDSMSFGDA